MTTLADDLVPDQLRALVAPCCQPRLSPIRRPASHHPRSQLLRRDRAHGADLHAWRLLPARELGCGSATTCWRRLTEWVEAGVWLGSTATAGGSSAPGRGRGGFRRLRIRYERFAERL